MHMLFRRLSFCQPRSLTFLSREADAQFGNGSSVAACSGAEASTPRWGRAARPDWLMARNSTLL